MEIFGNMQVLSFLSCVLTSLDIRVGTVGVEEANDTIMIPYTHFYSTQIQIASSLKIGQKRAKNDCKKNFFIFACSRVGHCYGRQYGSEKSCGEGVLAKKVF